MLSVSDSSVDFAIANYSSNSLVNLLKFMEDEQYLPYDLSVISCEKGAGVILFR